MNTITEVPAPTYPTAFVMKPKEIADLLAARPDVDEGRRSYLLAFVEEIYERNRRMDMRGMEYTNVALVVPNDQYGDPVINGTFLHLEAQRPPENPNAFYCRNH